LFDLHHRGAQVVDGSGEAAFAALIGVEGGRIVDVGRSADGARRVDLDGLVVTPGSPADWVRTVGNR